MAGSPSRAFEALVGDEAIQVLHALLRSHPDLTAETEAISRQLLSRVDIRAVADVVALRLLSIPLEDLAARAGRVPGGYVDEVDAAYELVRETIDPFITDLKRRANLGLDEAAAALGAGTVIGLYEIREPDDGSVLAYAGEDVPEELANEVLATVDDARLSLPVAADEHWPDWA